MATARKIRRRMSVDDANADLLGHVHQTIDRLTTLWDQVSMDSLTREKRTESAYALFYAAMNEIVANEEEMISGVFEDIERDLAEVSATRRELDLPEFPIDKFEPNSIALLKALGKDKKNLEIRRAQILHRQQQEKFVFQYLECYAEYSALSEKCYGISQMGKYKDEVDLDHDDVEALLNDIQHDLQRLQKRYESNKELFDKFAQWRICFKKQEDLEAELNTDKARKNRGGCLTKILAEQKKTNLIAERLLRDLKTACDEFFDSAISTGECSPYQIAMDLIHDREKQKENAKEHKKIAKATRLIEESRFGTSASPSVKSPSVKSLKEFL